MFLFCFGAVIGSFLHVVAERYGTGLSIVGKFSFPRFLNKGGPAPRSSDRWQSEVGSFCPYCKKNLTAVEMIPIFSYTLSRAMCRSCKAEIPFHYPVTELLTGLLAMILLASGQIVLFIAACVLVILIRIDSRCMLLPDKYIILLTGIALVRALQSNFDFTDSVFGVLAGAGALYVLWIGTAGKGLGFGDVKLMIPLGILFGLKGIVALLFIAFFCGGAVSVFLLVSHRVTPKTAVPFGPFLAGSALLIMVFPELTDLFFTFLGVY